jgi:hypothetical protein
VRALCLRDDQTLLSGGSDGKVRGQTNTPLKSLMIFNEPGEIPMKFLRVLGTNMKTPLKSL